ncbi:hypothetical protein UlMin_027840 [Ulmus minor]
MTSNGDAVVDIPIQGHDPIPTPIRTSSDQVPIQGNFQPPTPTSRDKIDKIDKYFKERISAEIKDRLKQLHNSGDEIIKIQQVPRIMLQQKQFPEDYYIPREMPIGPIYAEKENEESRQLKLKLAAQFIITSSRTCDHLIESIKTEIVALKTCFDKNLLEGFSDDELAWLLLLDGCSVLQFIYSRVRDELKELQINYGQASVIEQDLFLMANQIPYRVLEILMDSLPRSNSEAAFTKYVFIDSIDSFIRMNLMTPEQFLARNYSNFYEAKRTRPLHLLNILYSGFLYGFDYKSQSEGNLGYKKEFKRQYFRNIQDLKAVGIKLESSENSCLREVTFTSLLWFRARLKIPPLIVDDSTGRKLWNLIAYEMCPDNKKSEYGVTSYLSLLDSLIDSEEDVKDLRSAHILRNHLSCDADVAKLFNKIGYNVVSDQAYRKVKHAIQKHCDRWLAVKMSQLWQNYFSSPWSILALLGATAALALTATQTHFTIHPAK